MGDKEVVSSRENRIFENTPCTLVGFEFSFKRPEDFRFETFEQVTGWHGKVRFTNLCGSQSKASDYHLHLTWRITPPHSLRLQVDFHPGYRAPDKAEKEPFAENFLKWFKQFVAAQEFTVETYANFDFPIDSSKRFGFPLPMRVPIGPIDAEIDGISFIVNPPINGLEKIWVTQGRKEVNFHVHGKKVVNVASLEPKIEILEATKALESLFERRELEGKQ